MRELSEKELNEVSGGVIVGPLNLGLLTGLLRAVREASQPGGPPLLFGILAWVRRQIGVIG
jgi:bacteriocin-like protein